MKTCKKCLRTLPLSDFYPHKQMGDGHLSFCKECVKNRVLGHRAANLDRIRAYDRKRGRSAHRLADTRERRRQLDSATKGAYSKHWNDKNKHKKRAQGLVHDHLRAGKIEKQPCLVCNNSKVEAHHPDYSQPLVFIWLCRKHHGEVHRKNLDEITVPVLRAIAEKMRQTNSQ
jgi:hypothetical protein